MKIRIIDSDGATLTTTLLTETTAMSCHSFSLPAGKDGSCPMAVYGENTICSACYAMRNRFAFPTVANAQWIRLLWTRHLLRHDPGRWARTLALAIEAETFDGPEYFRWLDSGDLFSPAFVIAVAAVCRATPNVAHWVPTRSWQATAPSWTAAMQALGDLPNVTLRPSALRFNEAAPVTTYGPGTASHTEDVISSDGIVYLDGEPHHACPKTAVKGGSCGECNCRVCFEGATVAAPHHGRVSYLGHGWGGSHTLASLSPRASATRKARAEAFTRLTISTPTRSPRLDRAPAHV